MCILLLSLVSIHKDIWISMQRNSTLYLILWHFKLMRDSSSLPNWFCLLISSSLSATGQETMLQLLQWRSLIKQAVFRPLINLNARSRRYIDWLNAAPEFEKSFRFGQLWHMYVCPLFARSILLTQWIFMSMQAFLLQYSRMAWWLPWYLRKLLHHIRVTGKTLYLLS